MKKKTASSDTINLPTTEKEFDALVKTLVKKFKLPFYDHAAAIVAQRIQHLPPDQFTTTLTYLGHCVLKNLAYSVAQHKAAQLNHKYQIEQLTAELKSNPNNNEARDALNKAADQGSELAKEAIAKFFPDSTIEDNSKVISISQSQ